MSNIIIVGCGRVGSQLANMLSDVGDNVCCVDRRAEAFANLGRNFNGATVQGVGFDLDVLQKAGIEDCDVFAAVTQYDNANLMCAEVANRIYGVEHVIARLYNPDHKMAYTQLGIDYVCGTSLVADEIFSKVISGHGTHVSAFGDCEVVRFSLHLPYDRHSVAVSEIEKPHEVRVVAFERADGSSSSIPSDDSLLFDGDTVLACVKLDSISWLERFVGDGEIEGTDLLNREG